MLKPATVFSTLGVIGQNQNSVGTVSIKGEGSTWISDEIQIGNSGIGSLTLESQGEVASTLATIGTSADGFGVVTVRGIASTWANSGQLSVGGSGWGTLWIEAGGRVSGARALLARLPMGSARQ